MSAAFGSWPSPRQATTVLQARREPSAQKNVRNGSVGRVCKSEGCRSRKTRPFMAACDGFASDPRAARLQTRRRPPCPFCKPAPRRHGSSQNRHRPSFRSEKMILGTFSFYKAVAACHFGVGKCGVPCKTVIGRRLWSPRDFRSFANSTRESKHPILHNRIL